MVSNVFTLLDQILPYDCKIYLLSACTKPRKLVVMYLCARGIEFASNVSIKVWNC
jgi:hypothetical protein